MTLNTIYEISKDAYIEKISGWSNAPLMLMGPGSHDSIYTIRHGHFSIFPA
ncbi:MAG: hypothetical protein ACREBI_06345 [Nitrosotalea sp.]